MDLYSKTDEESLANLEISKLISDIRLLIQQQNPLIKIITSPEILISSLEELCSMIEMADIKISIVNQIKFLLTNRFRIKTLESQGHPVAFSKFENHMLHSVIFGNPGTGKTTVAKILAKIWMSLGFVKSNKYNKKQECDCNKRIEVLKEVMRKSCDVIKILKQQAIRIKNRSIYDRRNFIKEINQLLSNINIVKDTFSKVISEISKSTEPASYLEEPKFVVATREDLVSEFLGHTAIKTRNVLESARGGVLFIDEAYSLNNMDNTSKDRYGEECLNVINEFMSLYPEEIIIIMAGYKEKILNSIFKVQPGFQRRFTWFFEIKDYTPKGLTRIFMKQLEKNHWKLEPSINLERTFERNKDILKHGGGSTENLCFFVKIEYGKSKFKESINCNINTHDSVITESMLESALEQLRKQVNNASTKNKNQSPPFGMYS